MMKTMLGFACVVAILLVSTAPDQAWGGPVYNTLISKFCSSQSPKQKEKGCQQYFHLRIISDVNKDVAKSNCRGLCGRLYGSNPTDKSNCEAGCDYANSQDR